MISPPARAKNRSRIRTKPQKKPEFVSLRSAPLPRCWLLPHNFKPPSPPPCFFVFFLPPFPLIRYLGHWRKLFRTEGNRITVVPLLAAAGCGAGWWCSCKYGVIGRVDVSELWIGGVPVWTVGCERLCSPLHDFSWAEGSYGTAPHGD
jgi:hypothetical protein